MTDEEIDQLQREVLALLDAWADRGIAPCDGAQVIAATAHILLCKFDYPMSQLVQLIVHQWEANDGRH